MAWRRSESGAAPVGRAGSGGRLLRVGDGLAHRHRGLQAGREGAWREARRQRPVRLPDGVGLGGPPGRHGAGERATDRLVASARDEPIAIIGMGLSLSWRQRIGKLLAIAGRRGAAGIGEVPPDRWTWTPSMIPIRAIREGRSPEPAALSRGSISSTRASSGSHRSKPRCLDPQQRLLLETSWQALEDAGIDPSSLRGSRTGVFGGIAGADYREILSGLGADSAEAYWASGTAGSTAIGRISFALGLQGPAVATDTACSASLVAISEACEALRNGKADLALAGGVNAPCSRPRTSSSSRKRGMLAPDGLCKTFDAAADGYARGEGCGMVVLKCLSRAELDGDRNTGGHPRRGDQPGRCERRADRAERPGAGQVIAEALAASRLAACRGGLSGGARHRHGAGRPHRAACCRVCLRARP